MAAAVRVRKRVTQVNEASGKRIRTTRLVEDSEETGKEHLGPENRVHQ